MHQLTSCDALVEDIQIRLIYDIASLFDFKFLTSEMLKTLLNALTRVIYYYCGMKHSSVSKTYLSLSKIKMN